MPYVKQEIRPKLDNIVREMFKTGIRADGDLNYILYAFCKRHVRAGYGNYKNFCGELRQCATEIERTLLGPYEEMKKRLNGDVE